MICLPHMCSIYLKIINIYHMQTYSVSGIVLYWLAFTLSSKSIKKLSSSNVDSPSCLKISSSVSSSRLDTSPVRSDCESHPVQYCLCSDVVAAAAVVVVGVCWLLPAAESHCYSVVSMVIAFLMRNIILKTKKQQGKQPIVKMDIKKNCGKKFWCVLLKCFCLYGSLIRTTN